MIFLRLLLCLTLYLAFSQEKKQLVTGKIGYTRQYCYGAVPSEETLRDLGQVRPLSRKKLFIRKGKINDPGEPYISSVITDSNGTFQLHLPKGIYCAVSENKKDKKFYQQFIKEHTKETQFYSSVDIPCLNQWLSTPDFIFEVKDTAITVTHNYYITCSWNSLPCVKYHGPLPP